MTEWDALELDWWRETFSTRFVSTNLPRVGHPLYGRRFVLMQEIPEGGSVRFEED